MQASGAGQSDLGSRPCFENSSYRSDTLLLQTMPLSLLKTVFSLCSRSVLKVTNIGGSKLEIDELEFSIDN